MILDSNRGLWLILATVSAALALASIVLTLWLQLQPCHLCIFQRLLFIVMAVLALGAAVLGGAPRLVAGVLLAVIALGGLATATYQSWLQAQPAGTVACVGAELGPIERLVEWLGERVPSLFLATGFCEDPGLVIFGLSLAQWALLWFAAALAAVFWLLRRERRLDTA
ncbi:MAG: disulfide bond formation protein B [Thiohalocapsa sp.]|jgi:disulfide bond formation protein DsbB